MSTYDIIDDEPLINRENLLQNKSFLRNNKIKLSLLFLISLIGLGLFTIFYYNNNNDDNNPETLDGFFNSYLIQNEDNLYEDYNNNNNANEEYFDGELINIGNHNDENDEVQNDMVLDDYLIDDNSNANQIFGDDLNADEILTNNNQPYIPPPGYTTSTTTKKPETTPKPYTTPKSTRKPKPSPSPKPKPKPKPQTTPKPAPKLPPTQPLYRCYNPRLVDHFYATKREEILRCCTPRTGWGREGIAGYVWSHPNHALGIVTFYRYYNRRGDHFYTTNFRELGGGRNGYKLEGNAGYIMNRPNRDPRYRGIIVPFYRLYHPGRVDHFYTTSAKERSNAIARLGYRYEGIAGYIANRKI